MKIYPFRAIYPNIDQVASPDAFFSTVRDDYTKYFEKGFFSQASRDAFYILEIKKGKNIHRGLIVALDVTDYSKGRILKHEQTIESNEQEMLRVLTARGAMVKPVLLCHPDKKEISEEMLRLSRKMKNLQALHTSFGGNEYAVYQVPEEEAQTLMKLYRSLIPKVYIADGHHRCSTGEKLLATHGDEKNKDYSLLLAALFPFDQLDILDYNRIVRLPETLSLTKFMAMLSQIATIRVLTKATKPKHKYELTMVIRGEWYALEWKPEVLKKYRKQPAILDAEVLNKEILEGFLGIKDVRTDNRVEYVSGDSGAERVQDKSQQSESHIGFCIYPVSFEDLVKISDRGGTLPPKSTWFEPRMINGLVVKSY